MKATTCWLLVFVTSLAVGGCSGSQPDKPVQPDVSQPVADSSQPDQTPTQQPPSNSSDWLKSRPTETGSAQSPSQPSGTGPQSPVTSLVPNSSAPDPDPGAVNTPSSAEPAVKRTRIKADYSTAEAAHQTYCDAMLKHDWLTAYESFAPESQVTFYLNTAEKVFGAYSKDRVIQKKLYASKKAFIARLNINRDEYYLGKRDMKKFNAMPNKADLVVQMRDWLEEFNQGEPIANIEALKSVQTHVLGDMAVLHYKDTTNWDRLMVYELHDGKWGQNFQRSIEVNDMKTRNSDRYPSKDPIEVTLQALRKELGITASGEKVAEYEKKKVEPKFATAEEAIETYRLAMLHHDWETLYQVYMPKYQTSYIVKQVTFVFNGGNPKTTQERETMIAEREALMLKYNTNPKVFKNMSEFHNRVDSVEDRQAMFLDFTNWLERYNWLTTNLYWEEMGNYQLTRLDNLAIFRFQSTVTNRSDQLLVFQRQDGRWWLETRKTSDLGFEMKKLEKLYPNKDVFQQALLELKDDETWNKGIKLRHKFSVFNGSGAPWVSLSPDASKVAVSIFGPIQIWDTAKGEKLSEIEVPGGGENPRTKPTVAWSTDGKLLARAVDRELYLYSFAASKWSKAIYTLKTVDNDFDRLQWAGNGQLLLTITSLDDGRAELIEIPSGKSVSSHPLKYKRVPSAVLSPDGKKLLTGTHNEILVTDLANKSESNQIAIGENTTADVAAIAVSPDDKKFAAAQADTIFVGEVAVHDEKFPDTIRLEGYASFLAFVPDGSLLISVGKSINVIDAQSFQMLDREDFVAQQSVLSADGKVLATSMATGEIVIWDINFVLGEVTNVEPLTHAEEGAKKVNAPAEVRTWTSANGKSTIQAKLQKVEESVAHLEKEDGTVIKVPIDKLSEADQEFLKGA